MTAKNVKNTSEGAFGLPSGEVIQPGQEVRVANWDASDSNPVVKSWVESGFLVVSDAASEKKQGAEVADAAVVDPEPPAVEEEAPAKARKGK